MKKIPLNLIYLKYFQDAVKRGSISASAKVNHVSQSAISQAIMKLEESLECELISHQPTRFKVTDKGQQLFENSLEVFRAIERAEDQLAEDDGGAITFACTHSYALTLLPGFLKKARELYPTLCINFRLGHYYAIKEWIKKGLIDFGILLDNEDLSLFDCEEVYQGYYRLYVACGKDPTGLSFLLDSEERRETNFLKKYYKTQYGKELPVLMEISSWEVIARLTEKGLGIGFFPDYLAHQREESLQTIFHDLEPIPYKIYLVLAKNVIHSRYIQLFIKLLSSSSNP